MKTVVVGEKFNLGRDRRACKPAEECAENCKRLIKLFYRTAGQEENIPMRWRRPFRREVKVFR